MPKRKPKTSLRDTGFQPVLNALELQIVFKFDRNSHGQDAHVTNSVPARFMRKFAATLGVMCLLLSASKTNAAWFSSDWPYRREIDVVWDAEHGTGNESCAIEFYTDGHGAADGSDLIVATEDGKLVSQRLLKTGPGDRRAIVFGLVRNVRQYFVYFGNEHPAKPTSRPSEWPIRSGVLMDVRSLNSRDFNSFEGLKKSFEEASPKLGGAMIAQPFIGYNPVGDQQNTASKIAATLYAPQEGDYFFALACDDHAAMAMDGKPIIVAHNGPSDVRFNATVHLARGPHDVLIYQANTGGDLRLALAWRRPDAAGISIVPRESFGICFGAAVKGLEVHEKTFVADISATQLGECFIDPNYVFRYHFTSSAKAKSFVKLQWDFGDGQSSNEAESDHVYLRDGIYTVKLIASIGPNSDTQIRKLVVERDWARILTTPQDPVQTIAKILQTAEVSKMPTDALPRAIKIFLRDNQIDAAVTAGKRLASIATAQGLGETIDALNVLDDSLIDASRSSDARGIWSATPTQSPLQPRAAKHVAQLAMWYDGDFSAAVDALKPFIGKTDSSIERLRAQALILAGQTPAGIEILKSLPDQGSADRRVAVSGASARSIEYFIKAKEPDAGENAWDKWMTSYPQDFLEGYSVLLRVRLIRLRHRDDAAVKVAEAFVNAEPNSSYAPQLLREAIEITKDSNPAKSEELRKRLKEKYPETPEK